MSPRRSAFLPCPGLPRAAHRTVRPIVAPRTPVTKNWPRVSSRRTCLEGACVLRVWPLLLSDGPGDAPRAGAHRSRVLGLSRSAVGVHPSSVRSAAGGHLRHVQFGSPVSRSVLHDCCVCACVWTEAPHRPGACSQERNCRAGHTCRQPVSSCGRTSEAPLAAGESSHPSSPGDKNPFTPFSRKISATTHLSSLNEHGERENREEPGPSRSRTRGTRSPWSLGEMQEAADPLEKRGSGGVGNHGREQIRTEQRFKHRQTWWKTESALRKIKSVRVASLTEYSRRQRGKNTRSEHTGVPRQSCTARTQTGPTLQPQKGCPLGGQNQSETVHTYTSPGKPCLPEPAVTHTRCRGKQRKAGKPSQPRGAQGTGGRKVLRESGAGKGRLGKTKDIRIQEEL